MLKTDCSCGTYGYYLWLPDFWVWTRKGKTLRFEECENSIRVFIGLSGAYKLASFVISEFT